MCETAIKVRCLYRERYLQFNFLEGTRVLAFTSQSQDCFVAVLNQASQLVVVEAAVDACAFKRPNTAAAIEN